jgi:hypothetical protein
VKRRRELISVWEDVGAYLRGGDKEDIKEQPTS